MQDGARSSHKESTTNKRVSVGGAQPSISTAATGSGDTTSTASNDLRAAAATTSTSRFQRCVHASSRNDVMYLRRLNTVWLALRCRNEDLALVQLAQHGVEVDQQTRMRLLKEGRIGDDKSVQDLKDRSTFLMSKLGGAEAVRAAFLTKTS